jgi:hypothetical protein
MPLRSDRAADVAMLGLVTSVAAAFASFLVTRHVGFPSYDVYAAHYPNVLYALNALREGHGLLWNPLQNCGQPFLPNTLLGMFYPLNWLLFVVDVDVGFHLLAVIHLAMGAGGTYLLCRQLGAGRVGALVGGLCFGLGGLSVELAMWQSSNVLGIYVWIPWALWSCERILAAPSVRNGVALGVVLALQILGAYPQILLFTCQVIGLRVLWELVTGRLGRPWRPFGALALAGIIALCLGAVQLLPMAEFAESSIRTGPLSNNEMLPAAWNWDIFRNHFTARITGDGTTLSLIPLALAVAVIASPQRRTGLFYALVAGLYLALAFDNWVRDAYQALPAGRMFRFPFRFIWMTNFAGSVAAGLGVAAVTDAQPSRWRRSMALGALALGVAAMYLMSRTGLRPWEWWLVAALGAVYTASLLRGGARIAATIVPVLVLANLVAVNYAPYLGFLRDADAVLHARERQFGDLRSRMTLQDRASAFGKHPDYTLTPKTPQIFGVRSIDDYEPQTARRFAELQVKLRMNLRMSSMNEYLYSVPTPTNPRVMNLLATRYVLIDRVGGANPSVLPALRRLWQDGTTELYENPAALPRAFYVPIIRVVQPEEQVRILGAILHDPRSMALVDEPPADGFLGLGPGGTGEATIRSDRSETLEVQVRATAEGFLSLSDQYYPGWEATVNGVRTPILRGNAAFRLVRVPAGDSAVVFRYRPRSVRIGAGISAVTLLGLLALYLRGRRSSTGSGPACTAPPA